MAIRIQLRRDTAANWISANPTLREGEIGIETDTLKMKLGDGSSTWTSITNYMNLVPEMGSVSGDYLTISDIGAISGVVGLDANKNAIVTGSSIIVEGSTNNNYETTLTVTDPTADRTITFPDRDGTVITTGDTGTVTNTMLANSSITINSFPISLGGSAAFGTDNISEGTTNKYFTDERAQDAVAAALAAGTHTNITVTYNDNANSISLTGAQTYSDENAQDAIGNNLGTGLTYDDPTGSISVNTSVIQARVAGVSDTEIGYLDGVTSAIQTQIDSKAPLASPTFTGTVILPTGTVTSGMILDGTIVNADISSSAAIALSKLATDPLARANHTGTQLANTISDFDTQVRTSKVTDLAAPTGSFSMNSQKITNLATPTANNDAVNKAYVDAAVNNINIHEAVVAATTTNVNLTNAVDNNKVLDGVTLSTGNRILIKNQNTASQNGIYIVAANGAPTRATDYDTAGEVSSGDFIFVSGGTVNQNTGWIQTAVVTTVGTDALSFTQFSGAGTYTANNGLTLTGTAFSINTAVTADLTTAQVLTNKSITGTFTGNLTGDVTGNVSGNAGTVTNGVYTTGTYSNPTWITGLAWSKISSTPTTASGYGITDAVVTGGTYSNPTWLTSLAWSKISSTPTTLAGYGITDSITAATAASTYAPIASPTFTGTVSGITKSMVGLGNVENTALSTWAGSSNITTLGTIATGTWSGTTIATTKGGTGLTSYATGDVLYASALNTLSKLAAGTEGYLLTMVSGVPAWAAAPVSLPSQTGYAGYYLTTNGTSASWGQLPISQPSNTTISTNVANTVDTTALSGFTSAEYMVSLKQGSKVRTSKVILQTDGTSVDMTEFAITETGGTISGVVVSATTVSTNAALQVTVTDASTTNVTVKLTKIVR